MGARVNFDLIILLLLFLIVPFDLVNGIFLQNNIILPLSISQAYKLIVLSALLIKLLQSPDKAIFFLVLIFIMVMPSIYQVVKRGTVSFLFFDLVKVFRYILPLFSFFFFSKLFKKGNELNKKIAFKVISFSYLVVTSSVLLKYVGLGYPMYKTSNIGSRGFFFAGNELSFLLIILNSIIAFRIWRQGDKTKYFLFFIFNLLVGISLSSKTAIFGIFLVFSLIPIKSSKLKISLKRLKLLVTSFLIILPITIYLSWNFVKNSALFDRIQFFWEKLDVFTFFLSSRNVYAADAFLIYKNEYNIIEKLIGVGQKNFERLNDGKIIEIDFLDIFFVYGIVGLFFFLLIFVTFFFFVKLRTKKEGTYPYSRFVLLMLFLILAISTIAGHVFNSGIAGSFLGFLLALVYVKKE